MTRRLALAALALTGLFAVTVTGAAWWVLAGSDLRGDVEVGA